MKNYYRGVDNIAQNQWLKALEEHREILLDSPYMAERCRILEEIASHIEGISTETIDKTIAIIEDNIGRCQPIFNGIP